MARFNPFTKRAQRVRTAIRRNAGGRARLSVHRTGRHIYAQIIDDSDGKTVAAASTLGVKNSGANVDAATQVGKDIAAAAKKAGVTTVVFDRGGYLFYARDNALPDAAREAGLEF